MSGPSPVQRLHANLAYLKQRGASRERIQQELDKFKASQDERSAQDRKLSGLETAGAAASKFAGGATFGLFDEAAGLWGDKDTHRYLQKQLEEENPALAMGSEIAGALAVPIPFVKPAAKTASMAAKAGRVLLEGAIQGGLAGAGNAEGGLEERVRSAAKGATIGSVASGVIGGAARGAVGLGRKAAEGLGFATPSLEELVAKIPNEDIASARAKLGDYSGRKLGHEVTVADVLPQGEGALRQAATSNREVRKLVDTELRGRSNRLANEADARFSQHTGTQPASMEGTVDAMNAEASAKAGPLYREAEREAAAAPKVPRLSVAERAKLESMNVPAEKAPPSDIIDEALGLPYVQQRIGQLRKAPRSKFAKLPDDDHVMLDQVYKDIGKQIRSLDRKDWSLKDDLVHQRSILAEAITSRSDKWRQANEVFAGDMAHRDAYLMGHQNAPSDVIPGEIASLEPATVPNYKQGKAQALRRDVPNIDVGENARFQDVLAPIATKEKAAVFKATFGEPAYKEYVKDLLAMAGLQRMKAGAGESSTVDKLMEQLHGDPEAIVGMIGQLLRGNPFAAAAQFAPGGSWGRAIDKLRNSRIAKTNAEFLMRRGEPEVTRSLDDLVRMREAAQRPGASSFRNPAHRYREAAARTAGGYAGKN